MIHAVNSRRLRAACALISLALLGCGGESVASESASVFWHTEERRVERHHLPPESHAKIATLALPEVRWTGEMAEPTVEERIAVGVFADGSVSFGPTRLELDALTVHEGVAELLAHEAVLGTFPTALAKNPPPHVEVYVDRSASWERVRSVLLFLALPPRGVRDIRLAAVRSDDARASVWIPVRVERYGGMRFYDALRYLPEWGARLNGLPVFAGGADPQREDYDWGYTYGRGLTRVTDPARGEDTLYLADVAVPTPGRLTDEHVVLRANWGWRAWARRGLWDPRRYRGMEIRVDLLVREAGRHSPPARGLKPVPAAYPLQAVDLIHADGLAARILAAEGVYLLFEPPSSLAPPAESSALPPGVVLLCVLGVVLAFASVFVGSRRAADS